MFSFLQSIFSPQAKGSGASDEAIIQAATERVVDGTDPRLRAVGGYKKKLYAAVARSVEYVIALVDALPVPTEISRRSFGTDVRLGALFVSADHLREVIGSSRELKEYLQEGALSLPDEIYCLLSLNRSEKNVFGLDLQGGLLQRDVPQVVVNFSDHRLVGVTGSESGTRWELKKRAFDHLVQTALQRLLSTRTNRQQLEEQRMLLRSKLKAMQAGNWGLEPLLKPAGDKPPDLAAIEQQIAGIEAQLLALRADSTTLDGHLGRIAATLNEPQEHLRLDHITLTLDAMNIKRTAASGAQAATLALDEVVGGDRRRIVLFGHIPRADIPPPRDFIEEMNRYLSSG